MDNVCYVFIDMMIVIYVGENLSECWITRDKLILN